MHTLASVCMLVHFPCLRDTHFDPRRSKLCKNIVENVGGSKKERKIVKLYNRVKKKRKVEKKS